MVQNPSTPRRGRPPQFDTETVVMAAIDAFMDKGFDATTLSDLEAATGVDRSTLYNSFGGKAGLYDQATSLYLRRFRAGILGPLHDNTDGDGLDDVLEFLNQLETWLPAQEGPLGCLIVNDMAAGSAPEAAGVYQDALATGLRVALARAAHAGQTSSEMIDARVSTIFAAVIGINLIRTQTTDGRQIADLISGLRREVESWRVL